MGVLLPSRVESQSPIPPRGRFRDDGSRPLVKSFYWLHAASSRQGLVFQKFAGGGLEAGTVDAPATERQPLYHYARALLRRRAHRSLAAPSILKFSSYLQKPAPYGVLRVACRLLSALSTSHSGPSQASKAISKAPSRPPMLTKRAPKTPRAARRTLGKLPRKMAGWATDHFPAIHDVRLRHVVVKTCLLEA